MDRTKPLIRLWMASSFGRDPLVAHFQVGDLWVSSERTPHDVRTATGAKCQSPNSRVRNVFIDINFSRLAGLWFVVTIVTGSDLLGNGPFPKTTDRPGICRTLRPQIADAATSWGRGLPVRRNGRAEDRLRMIPGAVGQSRLRAE